MEITTNDSLSFSLTSWSCSLMFISLIEYISSRMLRSNIQISFYFFFKASTEILHRSILSYIPGVTFLTTACLSLFIFLFPWFAIQVHNTYIIYDIDFMEIQFNRG